jgi:hypothetical protein
MRVHTKTVLDIASGRILADEGFEYSGPLALCNMGTGAQGQDFSNSGAGQAISKTGVNNAASLYGTLSPTLSTMATNPQGINPADMAKIQTSNMQTAGGANSGAVGQGSLLAARTKNAGTADSAIAKSGEAASQNLSKANLSAQNENQQVKQNQQAEGLKGLQGLYGTNESAALGGLNESNAAIKNETQAPQSFWKKYLQGLGTQAMNSVVSGATGGMGGGE